MNSNRHKGRTGRVLAAGLGLALAGSMSLVAAAPAQAADVWDVNIDPSTIGANGEVNADWYIQEGSEAPAFSPTPKGLELHGLSGVAQSFGEFDLSVATVQGYIESGHVSWTTESAAANLEITVDLGEGEPGVTLTPVNSTVGETTVSLDQVWTTDSPIVDDNTGIDIKVGDELTLRELLTAVDTKYVSAFGLAGAVSDHNAVVTAASWPVYENSVVHVNDYTFLTPLEAGTVKINGKAEVGQTLSATVSGWPDGTTFTYDWGWHGGQMGGSLAPSETIKITDDLVTRHVVLNLWGSKEGFASVKVQVQTAAVSAPKKETAKAPAADSAKLGSLLKELGVEKQSQTAAGLPKGKLDAGKDHTATLEWWSPDSFVDVYLYSTPTLVGSFPVADGEAQITLSAEVLSTLEAGEHTLVVTGQSSGVVQAVTVDVAAAEVVPAAAEGPQLADTGAGIALPLAAAGFLLLAGVALVVARRRLAL